MQTVDMEPAVLSCIHGYIIHGKVKSLLNVKSPNSVPVTVGSGVGMGWGWGGGGGEGVVVGGRSERPLHVRGQARTVGGRGSAPTHWGRGRGRLYTYRYTVTTRMTPALRWAAMRAILMFH